MKNEILTQCSNKTEANPLRGSTHDGASVTYIALFLLLLRILLFSVCYYLKTKWQTYY